VLALDIDVWLLSVVALVASEGRLSSWNMGSGESLSPVSGRNDGDKWSFGGPSLKKLLDILKPWVENEDAASSIHGAMSALRASDEGGRLDTDGMGPFAASCPGLSGR